MLVMHSYMINMYISANQTYSLNKLSDKAHPVVSFGGLCEYSMFLCDLFVAVYNMHCTKPPICLPCSSTGSTRTLPEGCSTRLPCDKSTFKKSGSRGSTTTTASTGPCANRDGWGGCGCCCSCCCSLFCICCSPSFWAIFGVVVPPHSSPSSSSSPMSESKALLILLYSSSRLSMRWRLTTTSSWWRLCCRPLEYGEYSLEDRWLAGSWFCCPGPSCGGSKMRV
jgi:hypothetical protein